MNFKFINKGLFFVMGIILFGVVVSCTDDDVFQLDDKEIKFSNYHVDWEQKGALVIISDIVNGFYNFADGGDAAIGFTVDDFGGNATAVNVYKSLNGGAPVLFKTLNSFPSTINTTLAEAADGLIDLGSVKLLDQFVYTFDIATADGSFPSGESLVVNVSCPSDLGGTYTAATSGQSTDSCCPGTVTVTSTVELTDAGGGVYTISDWSGGIYQAWYEVYGVDAAYVAAGGVSTTIKDVCDVISAEFTEPFGTATTLTGSVDADSGVITFSWVTGYDDTATVVLTPM
ncbi:hypothetical protein [Portibacter lacus]|uniref:Uncharacterized protein n=1 Tax=Portibacter lacus TaxID=1099794 RepID=A0AA37SS22_9BACT|nr:hypothetical protein [Portibacter lacus]GLR19433.1 hypothetical protein GCM10007940_40490 [Portibacter lacus]